MSIKANFWWFSKRERSTARPTETPAFSWNVELRDGTSILEPIIQISGSLSKRCNYCYLDNFERYYWIKDWTWDNGVWSAYCRFDPLASWKEEIGNQNMYILRATNDWDGDVLDLLYPAKTNSQVSVSSTSSDIYSNMIGFYVVGIANDTGAVRYYGMTNAQYRSMLRYLFSDEYVYWWDNFTTLNGTGVSPVAIIDWTKVAEDVKALSRTWTRAQINPLQYIISVTAFYLSSSYITSKQPVYDIKIGSQSLPTNGILAYDLMEEFRTGQNVELSFSLTVPKHPQASTRGRYLNTAPYSTYYLDVKPFGRYPVDPSIIRDLTSMTINIDISLINGVGQMYYLKNGGRQMFSTGQVGVPIEVTQQTTNTVGVLSNLTETALSMATTGTPISLGTGVGDAVSCMFPQVSTSGQNSGAGALWGKPQLIATFLPVVDEDFEHSGRPLCQERLIRDIQGYLKCQEGTIKIPCLERELEEIRLDLIEGFYYE